VPSFLLRLVLGLAVVLPGSDAAADEIAWPWLLRQDLARVAHLQWKIRKAADQLCPVAASDIGAAIDHRLAYKPQDWDLLYNSLGMTADPVVIAVAPGSPADFAGLVPGDTIISIGSISSADIVAARRSNETAAEAVDRVIAQSPAGRPITLVTQRSGVERQAQIVPVTHCGVRVILAVDQKFDAHSDGRDVAITTGLLAYSGNDDELALAVAHEFGHAIGRHTGSVGLAERHQREDMADVTGIRLVACAGFDPDKAMALYRRLANQAVLAFLRAPTHRKFSTRIRLMTDALAESQSCQGF